MPERRDVTGLSVYRDSYLLGDPPTRARELATRLRPRGGNPTYVLAIPATTLQELGLSVIPDPQPAVSGLPEMPGHALIPELCSGPTKKSPWAEETYRRLAELNWEVHGPFDSLPKE